MPLLIVIFINNFGYLSRFRVSSWPMACTCCLTHFLSFLSEMYIQPQISKLMVRRNSGNQRNALFIWKGRNDEVFTAVTVNNVVVILLLVKQREVGEFIQITTTTRSTYYAYNDSRVWNVQSREGPGERIVTQRGTRSAGVAAVMRLKVRSYLDCCVRCLECWPELNCPADLWQ